MQRVTIGCSELPMLQSDMLSAYDLAPVDPGAAGPIHAALEGLSVRLSSARQ